MSLVAYLGYGLIESNKKLSLLSEIPAKQEELIEALSQQVDALQQSIADGKPDEIPAFISTQTDPVSIDPPEIQTITGSAFGVSEILSVMQGQYDGFLAQVQGQTDAQANHLNFLFAAVGVFVTVFSLAMPLVTYQILHKDIVDKLDKKQEELDQQQDEVNTLLGRATELIEKTQEELTTMRNANEKIEHGLERLSKTQEDTKRENDSEIERMNKAIENTQRTIENMHVQRERAEESKKTTLLQTKEIQPISDTPKDKARAAYQNWIIAYINRRYEEALEYTDEAIELEWDNARYYNNRGITLHELKRYEEALADASKAIELEGDNARYYNSRGTTLYELKRYEEALTDYNKAIELEGNNALYYACRGIALCKLKRYAEALKDVDQALNLDSKDSLAYRVQGLCHLAQYKNGAMDIDTASIWNDLTHAVELSVEYFGHYIARAQYSLYMKDFERAKKDLEAALALDNKYPDTYHWYARYYEAQGDMEKAREYDDLADKHGYIPEPDIKLE